MRQHRSFALVALGTALLLVACGDGGAHARTEEGLRSAARGMAEAMLAGDYRKAYDSVSKECRDQVTFEEFESTMKLGVTFVEAFLGVKFKDFEITDVQVRNFTPDGGEVGITLKPPKEIPGFDELEGAGDFEPWKWEDGKWVAADCSGLGGGPFGDDGDGATAAPTVPPPGSGPKLGETVDAGPARVTVHAVEDPARNTDGEPERGNRFVAIDVSIQAARGSVAVATFDFTVQDESGYVYDAAFFGRAPELRMTDLAQGRQVRGWVTFEVPQGAKLVAVYADLDFPKPETLILDLTRR